MAYKKQPEKTIRGQMSKANDKAVKAYNLTTRENILNDPTCPRVERVARPGCCSFCDSKAGFYSRPCEDNAHSHRDCKCVEIPRFNNGSVKYRKPSYKLNDDEKMAINTLVDYGYSILALEEEGNRRKNIDFVVNRKLVEHKNVTSRSSIKTQLGRSRKKFFLLRVSKPRTILTMNRSSIPFEEVVKYCNIYKRENETICLVYENRIFRITG